ncbi:MAG: von Willebrand factor type domain protein [Planctomycetaceae bacterium]|nr:von Willebrand factor type domain protein [Planctomycetaceae bacterium]
MFQRYLEWLFDVPPAEPGQGSHWQIERSFPWPQWCLLLFVILAAAFVVLVYRRDAQSLKRSARGLLIALRLSAIGVLLFMLSQAVLRVERTELQYVVVLVDTSRSMDTPDQYSNAKVQQSISQLIRDGAEPKSTRLNLAKALLTRDHGRFLKELLQKHKLRLYSIAETATWLGNRDLIRSEDVDEFLPLIQELEPLGEQTRLGPAVRAVLNDLRGTPPAAVVIISDGITSTIEAERLSTSAAYARSKGVPLYTVGIGNDEPLRDLALSDTTVDEVVFVDDPVKVAAKLKASGFAGQFVEIQLKQDGTNKLLQRKQIQIVDDKLPIDLELSFTPTEVGELDLTLEVIPTKAEPKEFRADNNQEKRHVSVRKEKVRVLLADNLPRFEFRFLKHLLEREKTVELVTVLQDSDPEYSAEDQTARPHFPVQKSELAQFDVIILGDVSLTYLSPQVLDHLRDFVKTRGGGLLFIAGPQHNPLTYQDTPLADLLPINLESAHAPALDSPISESFQPQLTVEGLKGNAIFRFADNEPDSLAVWNNLPGLFWMLEAPDLKAGAKAFATHPLKTSGNNKYPVIVFQRYGAGKVMFHATDETWRWRFRVGDLYYGRYWIQTLRYLTPSRLLGQDRAAELTLTQTVYQKGEPVSVRVRFLDDRQTPVNDDGVTVVLERPGDPQRKLKLIRLPQAPSTFEGQLTQLPEGSYHAVIETPSFAGAPPSGDFRIESPLKETRNLRLDVAELTQTAERTNAKYYPITSAQELSEELPQGFPVPLKTDTPKPLWNHYLALLLVTILLSTEWMLRKRFRLL